MADGYITIGTRLNTDKFDKQISDLENKMKKEEEKKLIIETKLSSQEQELDTARKKTDELADAYQRLSKIQEKVASGKATPTDFSTMQNLQNQYGTLEKIDGTFQKSLSKQDAIELKAKQLQAQYNGINQRVDEYKRKIEGINLQRQQSDIQKISNGFKGVGNSIQGAVRKAGKLALAIFGVRSAYLKLRQASSELASYDEQYAANLQYISFVLTQAIAPVLRGIVELAMRLLQYINLIAQAWFGVNLFSKGSADNFKKMKNSAGGVSKAVKEIKKQLTGFDEINVLSDQTSTSGGASAGGVGTPSFDVSNFEGEPPKWLKWILDNRDLILSIIAGITGGLIAWKLGLKGIQALGIGIAIAGIVSLIRDIIKFIKDPSWNNFANILQDLAIILTGVAIAMLAVNAANPTAWIILAIALVTALAAVIIKNWDKIKSTLSKVGEWINNNIIQPISRFFQDLWAKILVGALNVFNGIYNIFNKIGTFLGDIINKIISKFRDIGTKVGEVVSGAFKSVVNGVLSAIERILNSPIRAVNGLIDVVNKVPRNKFRQIKYI